MSRPWMPFYPADYLAGTGHLTTVEHGAYFLLILHYWAKEGLPTEDERLATIVRLSLNDWRTIRPTIAELFLDDWKHGRIEFELTEASRRSKAGQIAGKASGQARKRTISERSLNETANDPATKVQPLQSQSPVHGDGEHAHARRPLISPEALAVATEIGRISGYPEPPDWPLGWMGAPARVQVMLDQGWRRDVMLASARQVMAKKRDGPPDSIRYFERPFAKAHVQQSAPLPVVEVINNPVKVQIHATANGGGLQGGLAKLRDTAERLRAGAVPGSGEDAPRLLSDGRGQ